ncbi:MAG: methyltransferase domain-containing protein [bacterium]|nr:methyltransferase domain-containing protein [bacterium]
MFKLFSVVEKVESPYNGTIEVVRDLSGTRILVGGISQSGWLLKRVWKTALKKLRKDGFVPAKVLLLGVGGGSVIELIEDFWPDAKITGIEIDPLMINLGKKYLKLGKARNLEIEIHDATDWFSKNKERRFDLVLIDLYVGSRIPEKFKGEKFIKLVEHSLSGSGIAAFNHLYSSLEREDAHNLEGKLRKVFGVITRVQPEANIVYLCYRNS